MLEEFDDLISRLCANSPITQEEHRDRLFFTDDGLIWLFIIGGVVGV